MTSTRHPPEIQDGRLQNERRHRSALVDIFFLVMSCDMSCHGRHLGFDRNGNSAIRFSDPENPTLYGTEHEVNRIARCGDMAIQNSTYHKWCIYDPHFGGRRGRRGLSIVPFERSMAVSYMLSIMTIALYLSPFGPEMAMGWVHPWVGLGWVGSHFLWNAMGWVGLGSNIKM